MCHGIPLKPEYVQELLLHSTSISFLEVHAENYMVAGGPNLHILDQIRRQYALSIHGVGLSIGGQDALDLSHLNQLKSLVERYQPKLISEHLAWSAYEGTCYNDLLPLPYSNSTLNAVCNRIEQIQNCLKRSILIENPATYIEFQESTWTESGFIREIVLRTGCGLLLDITNAYISAHNHHWDLHSYLNDLPLLSVGEIHLAGYSIDPKIIQGEHLLIDTHGNDVPDEIWTIFEQLVHQTGPVPTLIERDQNLPPLQSILRESEHVLEVMRQCVSL